MNLPADAFFYDPDFRSRIHPKDHKAPYCCTCQRNLDITKAIAVTCNEETMMAVPGHGRAAEIRHDEQQRESMLVDAWIGKDCLKKLKREPTHP